MRTYPRMFALVNKQAAYTHAQVWLVQFGCVFLWMSTWCDFTENSSAPVDTWLQNTGWATFLQVWIVTIRSRFYDYMQRRSILWELIRCVFIKVFFEALVFHAKNLPKLQGSASLNKVVEKPENRWSLGPHCLNPYTYSVPCLSLGIRFINNSR